MSELLFLFIALKLLGILLFGASVQEIGKILFYRPNSSNTKNVWPDIFSEQNFSVLFVSGKLLTFNFYLTTFIES